MEPEDGWFDTLVCMILGLMLFPSFWILGKKAKKRDQPSEYQPLAS
jgi:hypothetical protein